jgi:hypothetical protein
VTALGISDHAVERFRERSGALSWSSDQVREYLRLEVEAGREEPHWGGQTKVLIPVLGVSVWAIIGPDTTGRTTRNGERGRAIATVLSLEEEK